MALISHTSKVILKILQARVQQYMNHEFPDVQAGFRRCREPEIKLPTSAGSSKKQESSRKMYTRALLTMTKPLTVWITINWKILKFGLKLNIQKTKIMASSPITLWQVDRETVETVADFIFLDSKITAVDDCSHEIKRRLLLGRKVMTNLDSMLKSRDITLSTKVCLVKAIVFQ